MRLFAAVDPPAEVVAAVSRSLAAAGHGEDTRLRWTPVEQWHLTLAFFGNVEDGDVPELTTRLGRAAARTSPMTILLADALGFPSIARAQVVALSVSGDPYGPRRLAERCAAAGRRTGLVMERRRFHPHLTLARVRQRSAPVDARELVTAYDGPPWLVTSLRLVCSTLGTQVSHDTVERWPLGRDRADGP